MKHYSTDNNLNLGLVKTYRRKGKGDGKGVRDSGQAGKPPSQFLRLRIDKLGKTDLR